MKLNFFLNRSIDVLFQSLSLFFVTSFIFQLMTHSLFHCHDTKLFRKSTRRMFLLLLMKLLMMMTDSSSTRRVLSGRFCSQLYIVDSFLRLFDNSCAKISVIPLFFFYVVLLLLPLSPHSFRFYLIWYFHLITFIFWLFSFARMVCPHNRYDHHN